ncbi:hypothetical protein BSKO_08159 [Bryopsis sp. KO-2023]|nr:hypothetical protein BSKO_08159 [Bryopsis sp. KO-2023]
MASSRPRRSITAPKKFGEEEGYLLPTREVHNARKVYRLLNELDLTRELRNQTVFVLWPDDKEWYEAKITKVDRSNLEAKLEYSETQEEEEVNLGLLVKEQHIAFMEFRSLSEVLGPDDIVIDSLDGLEEERTSLPHPGLTPDSVDGEGIPQSIVDELTPPLVAQETMQEEELVQPSGAHGGMASLQDRVIGTNAARFDGSAAVLHALGQRGAMGVQTAGIIPMGTSGVGPVGVVDNESVGFTDYVDMQALGSIVGGVHSDWAGCSILEGGGGGVRQFVAPRNINYSPIFGSLHHPPTPTTTAAGAPTVNRPPQSFQNLLHPVLRAVSSSAQPNLPQAVLHPGAPLFDGYAIQQRRDPGLSGLVSGANPGVLLGSNTICVQSSNRGMEVETGPGRGAIPIETLIDALQQPAPKRARSPTFDAVLVSQGAHAAKKPRSDPTLVSQSIASMLDPDVSQMAYPPMGMPPMQFAQFAQMPQGLHPNQQLHNLPHVMQMQQMGQFAHLGHPAQLGLDAQRPLSTLDPHAQEAAEMEDFSRNLLAGILGKKAQEEENQQKQATAQQVQPGISVIREKICSQFVADLEIAVKELKKEREEEGEGKDKEDKEGDDDEAEKEGTKEEEQQQEEEYDANAVGAAVEEELFQLCGSANKEYKSKARSLHFNLKDQKNPDLRGQVLTGHITAHSLVRMTAQELASSEEKKWREKKAEEFLKQSVLDTETAAAFSTAAALKKLKELRNERDVDPIPVAATDHIDQEQALLRKKSSGGESGVGGDDDEVVKVKSGGATELSNPDFDIAEALRKAESENVAIEQEKKDLIDETGTGADGEQEEFRHIEVPPSPPLSPLRSSSDDEPMEEEAEAQPPPGEKEPEMDADANDANEGGQDEKSGAAVYDPLSPAVFNEGDVAFDYSGDEGAPDWALPADEKNEIKGKEAMDVDLPEAVDGDASGNGTSYSPTAGAKSAYSPTAGWDDDIEDLAPIVLMPKSGVLSVGAKVWEGKVSGDSGDSFRVVCECVAGMGDLGLMLGTEEISIKGRVGLDKVENFLNDLRPSQNRTVTLGIMKLHGDATTPEQTFLNELIAQYSTKGRTAVIGPGPNLEGYLVSRCKLSARLCLTARNAVPLDQKTFVKDNIRANGELLLVLIHRKDWKPPSSGPPSALRGKGDVVSKDSKPEAVGTDWAGPNVMEWAGMSKEIAAEAGVEVENGGASGAGGQNEPARGSDPRLKDPRLRAGIREVETNKTEMQGDVKKSGLPPGVTPEAISDLAALFGIKGKGGAGQQSLFSQLGLGGPAQAGGGAGSSLQDPRQSSQHGASTSGSQIPGQMTIGGTSSGVHGFSSNQQFSQMPTGFNQQSGQRVDGLPGQGQQMQVLQVAQGGQQQSVVLLQGKPQFLSYDPTTGKAVPLDPSTVQYDPASNQVMLLGPLPPGAPCPGQMPQGQMGMMPQAVEQDRLLMNSQGIPILVKKAKKEGMGEGDMDVEEDEAGRVQLANLGVMGALQRNVQGYNGEMEVQQIDPMRGMQAGMPGMMPQMVQPPPPPPVQGQQDSGVSGGVSRGYGGGGGGVSGQQGGRSRGRGRDDRRRMRGRGRSRRDHGGGNHVSRGGGSKGNHYRDRSAAGNSEV